MTDQTEPTTTLDSDVSEEGGVDPPTTDDLFDYKPELDAPFVGAVPTIERQTAHKEFVEAADPDTVLFPIIEARKIAHDGLSATEWLPDSTSDTTVITSTTVSDDQLARLSWEKEREIVSTFQPDFHIPTDYPVYGDDDPEDREYNCMRCAAGAEWMANELRDTATQIIPLIKGTTPDERAICEKQAADLDVPMIALYGGQYFTEVGGGRSALVSAVDAINIETASFPLLVIGGLSPWVGKELNKNAVATAGLRAWRKEVQPRSATPSKIRERYRTLSRDVATALDLDERAASTK